MGATLATDAKETIFAGADWLPDEEATRCGNRHCPRPIFSMINRRHHCRLCGGIFCNTCAPRTYHHYGRLLRCCNHCRLPIVFRAHFNPVTGQLDARPAVTILSYLTVVDTTALLQSCFAMMSQLPVRNYTYIARLSQRFPQVGPSTIAGSGSFGTVYLCQDTTLGRSVAVKILPKSLHVGMNDWAEAMYEVDILTRSRHPNIVELLEVMQTQTELLLIMAPCGQTLSAVVREGMARGWGVEEKESFAADVVRQVAEGLAYLYADQHAVHRDVKPSNILIQDKDGRRVVTLIDFSVALTMTSMSEEVSLIPMGTKCFCSPEAQKCLTEHELQTTTMQALHKGDVYSLGVVLYSILAQVVVDDNIGSNQCADVKRAKLSSVEQMDPKLLEGTSAELMSLLSYMTSADLHTRPTATELLQHTTLKML